MISFDNTENAFKAKSDKELRRSYWLFKLIGSQTLVKFGAGTAPLALSLGFKGLFKATIFRQFVGGEDIDDCSRTIADLGKFHIGTILDYSVEGKESEADFDHCLQETIATIHKAKNDPHIPFCVFKVTGLARFALLEKVSGRHVLSTTEDEEYARVKERVNRICSEAHEAGKPVFIDAEETWIQTAIDDLAEENMAHYNKQKAIVYNTFQMYRKASLGYLKQEIEKAVAGGYYVGAKLVRGAYMEKERTRAREQNYPSPIQDTKDDTDQDYNAALSYCIAHLDRVAICAGTHNEHSCQRLIEMMSEKNLDNHHPHIYFSQLLGMSDHLSYNLAIAGYNVAKYVPYGPIKDVLPYLIRRAQENTSVKGQTGRELGLIMKELERRKKQRKR